MFPSTMFSRIVLYYLTLFPKLKTFQDIDWKNLIVIQRLYAKLSTTSDTPTRYQSPLCCPIIIFHDPGQNIPINLRNHLHAKKESPPSIHSPQVNALTDLENTSPLLASRRANLPSYVHQMETLYSSFFDEEARWNFGISNNVQFSLPSCAIVSRLCSQTRKISNYREIFASQTLLMATLASRFDSRDEEGSIRLSREILESLDPRFLAKLYGILR